MLSPKIQFVFLILFILIIIVVSDAVAPNNYLRSSFNKEQASRNYYPANYKRFRRGYGMREEDSNNLQAFKGSGPSKPFGTFRQNNAAAAKGGSRSFQNRKFPGFGGPDAFLSAAVNEDDHDEESPFRFGGGSSSFLSSDNAWSGTFKRRPKGGIQNTASNDKDVPSGLNFGRSSFNPSNDDNDGFFNPYSAPSGSNFGGGENNGFFNPFGSPGGESNNEFFNPFSGVGSGGGGGGAFGSKGNPFNAGSSFSSSSSSSSSSGGGSQFGNLGGSFPNVGNFGKPTGNVDGGSSGEKAVISTGLNKVDLNGGIEDLTGGKLFGPLSNMNKFDLEALLRQIDPQTTTKRPLRVISKEDENKIFSGGSEMNPKDSFGAVAAKKIGDCDGVPIPNPTNAKVKCTSSTGCRIDCKANYATTLGDTRLYAVCENKNWVVKTAFGTMAIPNCEPICEPMCQNDGICLSPNKCQCPDDWEGSFCEIPKQKTVKCTGRPPTPSSSRIFCSQEECMARCIEGYEFMDGITKATFVCQEGRWVISNSILGKAPDCEPICDPPCLNGGVCLAPNVCECPSDFRGSNCQFPISICDPKKLSFNGGHNCSGVGMDFNCILWCPRGISSTFPLAERYACDYATGKWSPFPIPECDYGAFGISITETKSSMMQVTQTAKPRPGSCFAWSGMHYKSFNGDVFSFKSGCPYTLIQDVSLGTFSINIFSNDACKSVNPSDCPKALKIFTEGDQYVLQTAGHGQPSLTYKDTSLAIPGQMNGLISERVAHYVVIKLTGIGLSIKWDLKNLFIVDVNEILWNRTVGLCGRMDGSSGGFGSVQSSSSSTRATLLSFLNEWKAPTLGKICQETPVLNNKCIFQQRQAKKFCLQLKRDPRFQECREAVDVNSFIEACEWDYCQCNDAQDPSSCACDSFSAFFRACTGAGGAVDGGWRTQNLCPMICQAGFEYKACMPAIQPRCGQAADMAKPEFCVEGCDCPAGFVLHEGQCVNPEDCPCTYHNKTYSSGDTIPNDCNSCTCLSGKWVCTEVKCGSRCSSVGDPHYTTFDGKKYDFMGKCSYYLVKGDDYSIEAENVPCSGAISATMNYPASAMSLFASCTHSLTLRVPGTTVELKQNREVNINGIEVRDLPIWEGGIFVKEASSLFITAILHNGLEVWWDGQTRAYVDAPATLRDATAGLCGTFNDNQKDDFLTPQGDIEQNQIAFANKWKTTDKCEDSAISEEMHPCERHIQNKKVAEKYCAKLKARTFASCHLEVDPETFYKDCLYDLCSCESDLKDCLCPILASYGKECTRKGIAINWRSQVRQCGVYCKGGQVYQICGNSCGYTCADYAANPECKSKCVEGCNCPEGFTLDLNKMCVPVSQCPCIYDDKEYKPDYEMFQIDESNVKKICTCKKAIWECRVPTEVELTMPEFFKEEQVICQSEREEYTECIPGEEVTCQTMHLRPERPPDVCRAGCRCKDGYVRDLDTNKCVDISACPCHHGGKSYQENQQIVEECNTCTCHDGVWSCTKELCPGICTAWGDSHFKTFDGRIFDFHGTCDYMLTKGKKSRSDSFEVSIQNVPCGTNGVTCAKSITLRVGDGNDQEVIHFTRNKEPDLTNRTRTIIREAGLFVFAEVTDMGLVLQWDKGTRAYITLDPSWRGKVKGLCGNYNGDENDDFKTPSGGVGEVSAKLFGDSWRLQDYCPEGVIIKDTCKIHPHRKVWATEKCAILMSYQFKPCHSEVPVDDYIERCQFDACGCDTGGDCHCLCTAIAAYAHECNIYGVHIKWRTPSFCPMQCDESCEHYEPCIPTCPNESCETYLNSKDVLCKQEACVEGCAKDVCPVGHVHKGPYDLECIPKADCDMKCIEIEGQIFFEGDVISEDACHTCYCSRKKKLCKGTPCTTPIAPSPTVTLTLEVITSTVSVPGCRTGWTHWINTDHPLLYKKNSDVEPLPERVNEVDSKRGFCSREMYANIRCRSVGTHEPLMEGTSCDLRDGLKCHGAKPQKYKSSKKKQKGKNSGIKRGEPDLMCLDFEMSLYCDCTIVPDTTATTIPETPATTPPFIVPSTTLETHSLPETCDAEGWTHWMNEHRPTQDGEFESIGDLRAIYSFCPLHYISKIECRAVDGSTSSPAVCDKTGAMCRNNAGMHYCKDYEVRVFCECKCQDGLGMKSGDIPDYSISASSHVNEYLPKYSRLDSSSSWVPNFETPEQSLENEWIQVHFNERKRVSGVITQGSPLANGFVRTIGVQISETGSNWQEIHDEYVSHPKIFQANVDVINPVTNLFPKPVYVRYIRIIPLTYTSLPALRFELKGCDIGELTTTPPLILPGEPFLPPLPPPPPGPECSHGWTDWLNSHSPSPADWDDIENYESLRDEYEFCEESAIKKIECRVSQLNVSYDKAFQLDVLCNKNHGLQCIDELQLGTHCFDYEVRFFCDCFDFTTTFSPAPYQVTSATICDPSQPNTIHEDCRKFYQCDPTSQMGVSEKTCGPGTLFNPLIGSCDHLLTVERIRPECIKTTTPSTTTEEPCSDHFWTEWYNVSTPSSGRGEFETFQRVRDLGLKICDNQHIMDIECQFNEVAEREELRGFKGSKGGKGRKGRKGGRKKGRKGHPAKLSIPPIPTDYRKSRDKAVTCSITNGLECINEMQRSSQCEDYEMRVLCSCESKKTTPYVDVRTATPSSTTEPFYKDEACPEGFYHKQNAIRCLQLCVFYKQLLVKEGKCLDDWAYAPGCVGVGKDERTCPPGYFLRDKETCVTMANCNCMLPNGMAAPPGKVFLTSHCEACKCTNNQLSCDDSQCLVTPEEDFSCNEWSPWMSVSTPSGEGDDESIETLRMFHQDVCAKPEKIECRERYSKKSPAELFQNVECSPLKGLICYNDKNPVDKCKDYEVRVWCSCEAPIIKTEVTTLATKMVTSTTTITLLSIFKCNEWSPFVNMKRKEDGDFQSIYHILSRYDQEGVCDDIVDIQCRDANAGLSALDLGQVITCNTSVGLICLNSENKNLCFDYEVSLYCRCPTLSTPSTPASHTTITERIPVACSAWSPWINEHNPYLEIDGDTEYKSLQQLREQFAFCLEGEISDIHCEEVITGKDISVSKNVRCDKKFGLKCNNEDQDSGVCHNFKIRYYCSCETTTSTRQTIIIPTTPTTTIPSVCAPERYINLLSDVEDSAFSASSSISVAFAPASARLYGARSYTGGAWIPNTNENQYLEIDLGYVRTVYGIIMSGSSRGNERVTSYSLLMSQDRLTWTKAHQGPLRGPFVSKEEREQILQLPIETRYVRIVPETWFGRPAVRLEIIGCLLATPSAPPQTTKAPICEEEMGFENGQLSDDQISVSSTINNQEFYSKHHIRLNTKATEIISAGAWVAWPSPDEYVKIDFQEPRILVGIVTQGRDGKDEWVDAYTLHYSPDGQIWTSVMDSSSGLPKVFEGNYDSSTPVKHFFDKAIEAQYLKLWPKSWHANIALRLEIIGCFHPYPTYTEDPRIISTTPITPPPFCDICRGVPAEYFSNCIPCDGNKLFDGHSCVFKPACPCYHDGIKYKIGAIFQSRDCQTCECEVGKTKCKPIECPKCSNKDERPVMTATCGCVCKPCPNGQRLCPSNDICVELDEWCDGIEHCYDDEAYCPMPPPEVCKMPDCPEDWELQMTVAGNESLCPIYECKQKITPSPMPCPLPYCSFQHSIVFIPKKDGETCPKYNCLPPATTSTEAPCPMPECPEGYKIEMQEYEDYFQYSQSSYDADYDYCAQYQCVPKDKDQFCSSPKCNDGFEVKYLNHLESFAKCPQYDCVPITTTTRCERVTCPDGLQVMIIQVDEVESPDACTQFTCVKITTPMPPTTEKQEQCSDQPVIPLCEIGEELYQTNPGMACPILKCRNLAPTPKAVSHTGLYIPHCKIVGKEFRTFDGAEFRMQTCHHILARDKIDKKWEIQIHRNCSGQQDNPCKRYLRVKQDNIDLEVTPDLLIKYGEYHYSAIQAKIIGESENTFNISRIGREAVLIKSRIYGFSVEWNINMDIDVIISNDNVYTVDGLCGFYTGSSTDDKTKPDGKLALSTQEYGDSWDMKIEDCKEISPLCSGNQSAKALKMCDVIQTKTFKDCHEVLPPATFLKGCVDSLCSCLMENNTEDECRCHLIGSYVTACLEKKQDAKIADWRAHVKCYKECPHGEKHYDCYKSSCENSCDTLKSGEKCEEDNSVCMSGCFCEAGLVRKGDACVFPELCRDCICEGYGDPHYMSFDRKNFTFNGDCTYVAARDKDFMGHYIFQVLVKHSLCKSEPISVCTEKLTVLFKDHKASIELVGKSSLVGSVDENQIQTYPFKESWITVESPDPDHIVLVLPEIQLELSYSMDNYGFTLRLPSSAFLNKLEGLCGNCNGDSEDDMIMIDGRSTNSVEEFGMSWLVEENSSACQVYNKNTLNCSILAPEVDPCLKLLDSNIFGKCNLMVDPVPYISSCQMDICSAVNVQDTACQSLEAYSRRCAQLGVCLSWRSSNLCPKQCPEGLLYMECGPSCVKTCLNYKDYKDTKTKCELSPIDGCFCPDGKVMDNGTCIPEVACQVCDDMGHRFGDTWKPSSCTICTCDGKGLKVCNERGCSADPLCAAGYEVKEVPNTGDDCCGPQKVCRLIPLVNCSEPVMDACGFGKEPKLVEAPGVCPVYACVCIKKEDCPQPIANDDELKPGEAWELDETGCCTRYARVCTGHCPQIKCPEFYEAQKDELNEYECCPLFTCESPKNACIYEHKLIDAAQGSKKLKGVNGQASKKILYKIGEKWSDGVCVECDCVLDDMGKPQSKCLETSCPSIEEHPDKNDFVLKAVIQSSTCCPKIIRTACLEYANVIELGSSWQDPLNGCRSIECIEKGGGLIEKVEKIQSCETQCSIGWQYEPSPQTQTVCCGACQQVACDHEGEIKNIGEEWLSDDLCTKHNCIKSDSTGKITLLSREVICSYPSEKELLHYEFAENKDANSCCSKFTRKYCLVEGERLMSGKEVTDTHDKCLSYRCEIGTDGNVTRKEKERTCSTECPLGHVYAPTTPESPDCCGHCTQTQCVSEGNLYEVGAKWDNPKDTCFTYSCQFREDALATVLVKKDCPYLDPDCPSDEIINDPTGCCKICNITIKKIKCEAEEIDPQSTIAMFTLEAKTVGKCTNYAPVSGLKRCKGSCESSANFVTQGISAYLNSECECCAPSEFSQVKVKLNCNLGYSFDRIYDNIEACECRPCQSNRGNNGQTLNDSPILDDTEFINLIQNKEDTS